MRLLFGMIMGAVIVVAAAFVADHWPATTDKTASEHRTMVNWDVVDDNIRLVRHRASALWIRLSHQPAG